MVAPIVAAEASKRAGNALLGDVYTRHRSWDKTVGKGKGKHVVHIETEAKVNAVSVGVLAVAAGATFLVGAVGAWMLQMKVGPKPGKMVVVSVTVKPTGTGWTVTVRQGAHYRTIPYASKPTDSQIRANIISVMAKVKPGDWSLTSPHASAGAYGMKDLVVKDGGMSFKTHVFSDSSQHYALESREGFKV